jgi:hypothetical protein
VFLIVFQGTQIFCGKIYHKYSANDAAGQDSAEFECVVTPIGSGREVVTSLAVSCAHTHIFIALADGHCMRWSFSASPDPTSTIVIDNTSDLVFPKTSDVRMGPVHSMHASPYGSYLTMTRSSQSPGANYTPLLRLARAIYVHRCSTDTVIFPVAVAAATSYFIIPWNGAAALELYSTCQRASSYWKETLVAIWLLVSQTSLPLENAFRGLQAILNCGAFFYDCGFVLSRATCRCTHIFCSDYVCSAHRLSPGVVPFRWRSHVHPQARDTARQTSTTI